MDADRLQLQERCAAAEEKAEGLQKQLQDLQRSDAEVERLQKELEVGRRTDIQMQVMLDSHKEAFCQVKREKLALQLELDSAKKTLDQINARNSTLTHQNKMDENVMHGLKVRMETAENELERLKRKRTDSISPERVITGILKHPSASSLSAQQAAGTDIPPASAQPTPKKSRTRKERWSDMAKEHAQDMHSSSAPPTSSNQDGGKEKKEHTSMAKKKDPVLTNTPYSFRKKQDIIDEIRVSANTLGLSRSDTSLVFYRSIVDDQVRVSKKALAYVELLITSTCVHLLKSSKFAGNPVKAYLDTLSLSQLIDLKKDVEAALDHCEDSNRYMAVYSGGSDLSKRIRKQCFDKDGTPLKPHKLSDPLQRLHERLGCHSQHSIPIGFYYAKWSEKLQFHLARALKQDRSHSRTSSSRTRTPSPKMAPASTRSSGDPSRSPNPPDRHIKSPTIASSSAAARVKTIEEAEESVDK
jgi:hypothetical protein